MVADGFLQAGGQRAAVDAHAIGQQDHSGKLLPVQILAQQAAEPAPRVLGPRRIGDVRLDQTEPGVAKTAGDRDQSVLVEIVIKDGSCRTAAEAQGPGADPRERLWRLGRGDGARRPEIEHEIGTGQPIGAGPAHAPANPGSPTATGPSACGSRSWPGAQRYSLKVNGSLTRSRPAGQRTWATSCRS